jgi:integrase
VSRRGRVWQEGRAKDAPAIRGAPWYFVVDIAPPGAKRRQVFRRGFATKEDAQATLDDLLGNVRGGTYVEPSRATFGEYLRLWLDGLAAKGRRPTTIAGYRAKLIKYVFDDPIAAVPLQQVTAEQLDKLYAQLVTRRDGRPLSLRTVRHVHQIISTALAAAERQDRIAVNPARRASPPSATAARAPEAAVWSPEELRSFLDATKDHHHGALFRLAAMTGLRRGELCGLRWADVDLDAGRLVVRRTITTVDHEPVEGDVKTARSRRGVDLDEETVRVVRQHQTGQLEQRVLMGAGYTDRDLVFAAPDGAPWNPDSIGRAFARAVARTELPRIRLHDLRHSHATHLLAAGQNPKLVSDRLGHATVGFTLDTYGHVIPGQQADAAAAVARLVDGESRRRLRAL